MDTESSYLPENGERRRSPRLEVMARVYGSLIALDLPITLLNMNRDGFLMQAPINFPVGVIDEFRFTTSGSDPIVLRARVVHTIRATAAGTVSYAIGLEFLDHGADGIAQAINELHRHLASADHVSPTPSTVREPTRRDRSPRPPSMA